MDDPPDWIKVKQPAAPAAMRQIDGKVVIILRQGSPFGRETEQKQCRHHHGRYTG
jgi:hypothetical protein